MLRDDGTKSAQGPETPHDGIPVTGIKDTVFPTAGRMVKISVVVIYAISLVFIVLIVFKGRFPRSQTGSTPFYTTLMNCTAYAKKGFDVNDILSLPDLSGGAWKEFP
ncbi:MAG: hypothetical protein LBB98_01280 [Treponema sp.]|jgi:hypothetical protein|nr:hypothetical protein [Treponema sp.]